MLDASCWAHQKVERKVRRPRKVASGPVAMLGEEVAVAETEAVREARQVVAVRPPGQVSRHRRVHKEIGAVTGISFVDVPPGADGRGHGVLVSALSAEGGCAKSGVCVGDHVTKINGEVPRNHAHAVELCDAAWTAEADGTDKNKDRLKFSLHRRTQGFTIGIHGSGLVAGTISVEVLGVGNSSSLKKSLLSGSGGGKKLEHAGLTLEDSPAGFGALVNSVVPELPAHAGGLETGVTVVAVEDVLCPIGGSHVEVMKMIDAARAKKGSANIVCHLKKARDGE